MNKKVALYLRLSKEDFDKKLNLDISESIKNQELMLKEEVAKHKNWEIIGIYCDEDFSGVGTYRPEFERMIKDCESGIIDIVICKSQSRFSRDMEIVEKYLHNKFLEWNIRFISLVDNIDTELKGNKKTRQINALVNEWFLEELSDNIKATFRSKWKVGECTAAFAKYGLMKDPKNKNHLIIDPVAGKIVKEIGKMFLAGYGQEKIAQTLEAKNIPSPYEYKVMNGSKLKLPNNLIINTLTQGSYIIKYSFFNRYKNILKNIKGLFWFGKEKIDIKVRFISDNLELFYCNDEIKEANFKDKKWKRLLINDNINSNIKTIGCRCQELDRLNEINFELEVIFRKNNISNNYGIFMKSNCFEKIAIEFSYTIRKKYSWNSEVIYKMLRDESYNGTLIQGKTGRISYKNHKCVKKDKKEWIKYPNAIEKIFDDDMWNKIQEKFQKRVRSLNNGIRNIFEGKVYCNECGELMHRNCSYNIRNKDRIQYLVCRNRKKQCPNNRSIRIDVLEEYVLNSINKLLNKYFDITIIEKLYQQEINKVYFKNKLKKIKLEKDNLIIKQNKGIEIIKKLYEDRVNNIINNEEFMTLLKNYRNEEIKFQERLKVIEKKLESIYKYKKLEETTKKYQTIAKLTPTIIDLFIKDIRIEKVDKDINRKIQINWRLF